MACRVQYDDFCRGLSSSAITVPAAADGFRAAALVEDGVADGYQNAVAVANFSVDIDLGQARDITAVYLGNVKGVSSGVAAITSVELQSKLLVGDPYGGHGNFTFNSRGDALKVIASVSRRYLRLYFTVAGPERVNVGVVRVGTYLDLERAPSRVRPLDRDYTVRARTVAGGHIGGQLRDYSRGYELGWGSLNESAFDELLAIKRALAGGLYHAVWQPNSDDVERICYGVIGDEFGWEEDYVEFKGAGFVIDEAGRS